MAAPHPLSFLSEAKNPRIVTRATPDAAAREIEPCASLVFPDLIRDPGERGRANTSSPLTSRNRPNMVPFIAP